MYMKNKREDGEGNDTEGGSERLPVVRRPEKGRANLQLDVDNTNTVPFTHAALCSNVQ